MIIMAKQDMSQAGALTLRIRARIQEAYQTGPQAFQKKWEAEQERQRGAPAYIHVPGLAQRFAEAGLSQAEVAAKALVAQSTVRRALRRDLYSPEILAAIRELLGDEGTA